MISIAKEYSKKLDGFSPQQIIGFVSTEFNDQVCFASSLGLEDQVLTDMIVASGYKIRIFTLDTGRMFPETYSLLQRMREKYGNIIEVIFPDYTQVEEMVTEKGMNLFYESIESRKLCCHIRKTLPSKRVLNGMSAWITGLRRSQSASRQNIEVVEWDEENGLYKINPLFSWELADVWNYIRKNNVPYNSLHDKGFPTIGCQPCTRAIKEGDEIRSGRWWWEDTDKKECGLHQ
jgi:phosphoadenosine phosphosulfate reductase